MKKNLIILLFIIPFLNSCVKETPEDIYIKESLPKVLSLPKEDIEQFKSTMSFNADGNLSSWNDELLEKAYNTEEDYEYILTYIYHKLEIYTDKIVVVDSDNNEKIVSAGFYDINNEKISLLDIQEWNALFYITSTNCGTCISQYKVMNELASKYKDKGIKFVAIFEKVKNIENYKKGEIFKTDGFLSDDWIILQKNKLIPFLTEAYNDSLGVPFVFFRKDEKDLGKYPKSRDKELVEKIIIDTF